MWRRPDREADELLRSVDVAHRSWFAATAEWLFAGRRGAARAGNVVRGNLLIALTDAETTGHAIGLAIGVVVMYAGFRRTLQPVESAPVAAGEA